MSDTAVYAVMLLNQVTALLQNLTADQLDKLADGRARLAFVSEDDVAYAPARTARTSTSSGRKKAIQPSVTDAAERLGTIEDVIQRKNYLNDSGFVVDDLKSLAEVLHISLRGIRRRDQIIDKIAEAVVVESSVRPSDKSTAPRAAQSGFERLMGGPWRR